MLQSKMQISPELDMRRRVSDSSRFQGRWVCPDLSAASCSVCRNAVAPLDSRSDGASTARARSSAILLNHSKETRCCSHKSLCKLPRPSFVLFLYKHFECDRACCLRDAGAIELQGQAVRCGSHLKETPGMAKRAE